MTESLARWLLGSIGAYGACGVLFAVPFAWRGVNRLDPGARGAGWGFRLLLLPGAALFWPLLLKRVIAGASAPPRERNAHDRAAAATPASAASVSA